ncbi:hypothetical protein ME763_13975 [Streptomyces murinus]|uniref:hypothetical protein n=1 Tax=Streptomyces murinus TaxID=33900 RepID=UPI000A1D9822|nr:hypothetical protein [Streptomyces murinus]WDO06689.1 hypothetical protein ME763_13975 [Streptomyces murinus]
MRTVDAEEVQARLLSAMRGVAETGAGQLPCPYRPLRPRGGRTRTAAGGRACALRDWGRHD